MSYSVDELEGQLVEGQVHSFIYGENNGIRYRNDSRPIR
ncbi:hypothetical protein LEP1GSC107_3404 [Leptospira interrogans serovar Grippotyphosa str. UI 12769]|uniref:Uncharacterized protein n=4 Tax=Leptospira interrogans TaxID=173 RepID=A0A829CWX8_LEPIR|nr:hypothetical protein G436_4477 [Leptospira interrogans serovar Hardjo str. Norma]EKO04524.1 hypothetical protein LEP1GSC077_0082 [Leptospira interrogans str. C10069]EKO24866.1 hypothetical protein LEP1GSC104_0532 [Leptospira interrogans str. UI 12621]EKO70387.1 hypothetical protein LEP1GSC069_2061 [Leptospira interrogans serovar Canicola str. Fiocruz LV133]EKQ49528.1 hypothetical protein LEP1GSC026_2397 [Leptospira interrogans str. 2002000623]EKR46233.1 hypothetical protein LEP1GSC097_1895 